MEPFRFHTPCSILVIGSSGCGKTVFVDHLLQQMKNNFDRPIHKVVYCHGVWQDHFNNMQARDGIKFHEGLPSDDLGNIFLWCIWPAANRHWACAPMDHSENVFIRIKDMTVATR